jgi:hypothetical protein
MARMGMIVRLTVVRMKVVMAILMVSVIAGAVGMGAHRLYSTRPPEAPHLSPALIGQFDTAPPRID